MTAYCFRIHVYLSGDTKYLLCTVESADAAAEIIRCLCGVARPEYQRIEVEISRMTAGE